MSAKNSTNIEPPKSSVYRSKHPDLSTLDLDDLIAREDLNKNEVHLLTLYLLDVILDAVRLMALEDEDEARVTNLNSIPSMPI